MSLTLHIAVFGQSTMETNVRNSQAAYLHRSRGVARRRLCSDGAVLGVVGLYGVIAYSVSQRTREIGVRMALGAQRNAISGMVLREAMRLIAIGIAAGVAGSLATAGAPASAAVWHTAMGLDDAGRCRGGAGCRGDACKLFAGASGRLGQSSGRAAGGIVNHGQIAIREPRRTRSIARHR